MNFWNTLTKQQKQAVYITAGILVVVIIALIIWLLLRNSPEDEANTPTGNTNGSSITVTTNSGETLADPQENTVIDISEEQAIIAATKSVAQRYGTFSTDTGTDAVLTMNSQFTGSGFDAAVAHVSKELQNKEGYYGVSTVAASFDITDYTSGATGATVQVTMRRSVTNNDAEVTNYTQEARVQLVKSNDAWLVDVFTWQ